MKDNVIRLLQEKKMEEARRAFWRWVFVKDIDEIEAMGDIYGYYPEKDDFEDFRNYMYHNTEADK